MARVHVSWLRRKLGFPPLVDAKWPVDAKWLVDAKLMVRRSRGASRLLSDGGEEGVTEKESRYLRRSTSLSTGVSPHIRSGFVLFAFLSGRKPANFRNFSHWVLLEAFPVGRSSSRRLAILVEHSP